MSNVRFSIIPARAVFDPNLQRAALHVLAAIGTYGDRGGWCRPSLATIGEQLACSKQAIGKQIKILTELGYLEVSKRYRKDGGQSSNLYRIRFDVGEPDAETVADLAHDEDDDVDAPSTSEVDRGKPLKLTGGVTSEVDPILERPNSERPIGTEKSLEAPVPATTQKTDPQKRGSRLPADWTLPDDWRTWAQVERPDVDAGKESEKFRDYWHAKAGKDAAKVDWSATWRNWVRNARAGKQDAVAGRAVI